MTRQDSGARGALTLSDLDPNLNHEPRVRDLRVAERLGMSQPLNIRALIEANRAELEMHGEVFTRRVKTTRRGGRPGTEYWLTEGQVLVLCMLSRTPAAARVRREVIEVFMAWRRQATGRLSAAAPTSPPARVTVRPTGEQRRLLARTARDWARGDEAVYRAWLEQWAAQVLARAPATDLGWHLHSLGVDPWLILRAARVPHPARVLGCQTADGLAGLVVGGDLLVVDTAGWRRLAPGQEALVIGPDGDLAVMPAQPAPWPARPLAGDRPARVAYVAAAAPGGGAMAEVPVPLVGAVVARRRLGTGQ